MNIGLQPSINSVLYEHWSVKAASCGTALSVITFAAGLFASFVPQVSSAAWVLFPLFTITSAATCVICTIAANYLRAFIPKKAFEDNLARYQQTTQALQKQLEDENIAKGTLNTQVEQLQAEAKSLVQEKEHLEQVLVSEKAAMQSLQEQVGQFKQMLEDEKRDITGLLTVNEALIKQNHELADTASQLKQQNDQLKGSLVTLQKDTQAIAESFHKVEDGLMILQSAKQGVDQTDTNLETLIANLQEGKNLLQPMTLSLQALSLQLNEDRKQIDTFISVQDDLTRFKDERRLIGEDIVAMETHIETLAQEAAGLKEVLHALDKEHQESEHLNEQVAAHDTKMAELIVDIAQLQQAGGTTLL